MDSGRYIGEHKFHSDESFSDNKTQQIYSCKVWIRWAMGFSFAYKYFSAIKFSAIKYWAINKWMLLGRFLVNRGKMKRKKTNRKNGENEMMQENMYIVHSWLLDGIE